MIFSLAAGTRSAVCAACDEKHYGYGVEVGFGYTPFENLRVGGSTLQFLEGNGARDLRGWAF